jgi:class 3 adenylate cyclase/predicted ATPase
VEVVPCTNLSAIALWLAEHGLGHLATTFAENGIEDDVLCEITEADLKELGLNFGDRKRLLKAISARGRQADIDSIALAEPTLARPIPREAERRQLTVMFVDLVGSTTLSSHVDPEDFRAILQVYREACAGVVARFDGHIAQYMGDGILIYFCYPQAHEDDAERAVRAGLGIVEAVGRLTPQPGLTLQVRIGIATGLVVAGDLVGEGVSGQRAVSGDAPNLAARLQGHAAPDTVLISPATRNLVMGLFELEDGGLRQLKGIDGAVRIWRVAGEARIRSRFEAARSGGLTPLVARNAEIDLLQDRWRSAVNGEGQVVHLSGEPGIGKSRLSQSLGEQIANEPHARLRYQCSPYHTNSALFPITTQLQIAARIEPDDSSELKLEKLEAVLAPSTPQREMVVPLLATALSIPTGDRYAQLNFPPARLKELTLEALVDQLLALAQQQPVLFLFEDAHWVDPTTLQLLNIVIDRIQHAKVLVVATSRPEFVPPWDGYTHSTALTLLRLGRHDCELLVSGVTGGLTLPPEALAQIVDKTDGMPLFVEELTRNLLESGILDRREGGYVLKGPLPPLAIPTSLQDSLRARLDRLSSAGVAQLGATIGREFPYKLIALVSPLRDAELQEALHQLVSAQLVSQRGPLAEAAYIFKHALVQDTAYESLLRSTRHRYHQEIAAALEQHFEDVVTTQPEVIAHHFTEAQLPERAIAYWQIAGQRASQRSAMVEALAHLYNALELQRQLPETVERDRQELGLRIELTSPLIAAKGFSAPEMQATIDRALILCERLGETTRLFPVLYAHWVFHHTSGQVSKGLELAKEALALAEREPGEVPRMVAHRILGIAHTALGEPSAGLKHLEAGNLLYDLKRHRGLAHVYGMDFLQVNLTYIGLGRWLLGQPDRAAVAAEEAIRHARTLSHVNSLCHSLSLGPLHIFNRRYNEAGEVGAELLDLAARYGMPQWDLLGRLYRAVGLLWTGDEAEGAAMLQDYIARCRALPFLANITLAYAQLAAYQLSTGAYQEALDSLVEAERIIEAGGERWARSELLRLKGEICLAQSAPEAAQAAFHEAIAVAGQQPARLLELRSATSLARLWQGQGSHDAARALLEPLYGGFSEGFDLPDLVDAKALLDELV